MSEVSDVDVGGCSDDVQINFRHSYRTKFVGALNKKLTVEQRLCIEETPFGWFTMLNESVKISRKILSELCIRWVERRGGFFLGYEVVKFNLLDVCLGLGLRVVGDKIDLNEANINSECRKLLCLKKVTVNMINEFLSKGDEVLSVVDFCKLYILLGISEFLLSNRNGTVFGILFKIVDDLNSLHKYNWGGVVYEYLVGSLCGGSLVLRNERNRRHFHVVGCVYLLQLWAFSHFLTLKTNEFELITLFPRVLRYQDVHVGDSFITSSLTKVVVVHDVAVSREELRHVVVKEGLQKFGHRFDKRKSGGTSRQDNEKLRHAIEEQEHQIRELEGSISNLKALLHGKKNKQKANNEDEEDNGDKHPNYFDVGSTEANYSAFGGCEHNEVDDNNEVEHDEGIDDNSVDPKQFEESNLYGRLKNHPRVRVKSRAIRTPFTIYGRKRPMY